MIRGAGRGQHATKSILELTSWKWPASMRRSASAIEQELLTTDTMRISSPEFHALSAEEQLKLLPPVRSGELS